MWKLLPLLFIPIFAQAAVVDLLSLKPTQTNGSVSRGTSGDTEMSAGFFSVAAIYQQMQLKGKSFDIKAVFTRSRGSDGVGFVFPVGDQKAAAVFGGWSGQFDGLNQVDGYAPNDARNSTSRGSKVSNGDELRLKISVRPDRVAAFVNDKLHFEVDPRAHKLTVARDIDSRFQDGLGLYIINGDLSVSSWTIEEVK